MNKELKEFINNIKSKGDYGQIGNGCCILLTEDVNILIEAIEKQDELIDYLRRSCERKDESIISMRDEDTELASKVEQQEKIIDLMANHIATSDSELCEYLDITAKCKYYAGDNGKTCDSCIKQYFENKSKEVKND